ncbi:thioredoxin family protein [Paenibacillus thalictri]|uniref:Thioredoxin n=1 Tax=Paenibacillus thalictri TaxID=2527873 RepID=A0A4Q9DW84_9BACL|nr:thioredoxin family protein [Paenibacillus thalictri]TBL80259.1 thioredoxin [Paenibacillus thalictri]
MRKLIECTERELLQALESGESRTVFFYTPFCGTCKLTERMLDIILQMEPPREIWKCNVNFSPQLCREWQIASVPCLLQIVNGEPGGRLYRVQSVDALYAWLEAASFGNKR